MKPQVWDDQPERRMENDGWGMCDTSPLRSRPICALGGIGCVTDHKMIRLLNAIEHKYGQFNDS